MEEYIEDGKIKYNFTKEELFDQSAIEDVIDANNRPTPYNIYSRPIPIVKHYHDLDTTELYVSYSKIQKLISDAEELSKKSTHRGGSTDITLLRDICQAWLDDVRWRQDGVERPVWIDFCKYLLKGKLKKRKAWLNTLSTICYDMIPRLNAIDGGNVSDENQGSQVSKRIGF